MSELDPNQNREEDMARLKQAVEALSEHFDTVQVFATRSIGESNGDTIHASYGIGNWFARYGHVRSWLTRSEEDEKARVWNDIQDDDDDDDDDDKLDLAVTQ